MSVYVIPVANKIAAEAVVGPLTNALVDSTGAITYYLSEYVNAPAATNTAMTAAGATVFATREAAQAAFPNAKRTKTEAVETAIRTKAADALTANSTFLATIAGRRASIATAKTTIATNKATATTGKTATVSTIAQAQTQVRSLWTVMEAICTLLDGVATLADVGNNRDEVTMKELNGLIRLALAELDSTADT